MKNLFKIACIILVFAANMAMADAEENSAMENRCAMYLSKNHKVNLAYLPNTQKPVVVRIYNAQTDLLILTDRIKSTEGFNRSYDISQLEEGKYIFEIIENNQSLRKEFIYNRFEPQVPQVDIQRQFDSGKATITVCGASNPVKIKFYDQNNRLLFSDQVEDNVNFKRNYDISSLGDIRLIVEIVTNEKVIKQRFI